MDVQRSEVANLVPLDTLTKSHVRKLEAAINYLQSMSDFPQMHMVDRLAHRMRRPNVSYILQARFLLGEIGSRSLLRSLMIRTIAGGLCWAILLFCGLLIWGIVKEEPSRLRLLGIGCLLGGVVLSSIVFFSSVRPDAMRVVKAMEARRSHVQGDAGPAKI